MPPQSASTKLFSPGSKVIDLFKIFFNLKKKTDLSSSFSGEDADKSNAKTPRETKRFWLSANAK